MIRNIIKIEPNTGITFTADGELIQQYETKKQKNSNSVQFQKTINYKRFSSEVNRCNNCIFQNQFF